jgi:hypothetical protein
VYRLRQGVQQKLSDTLERQLERFGPAGVELYRFAWVTVNRRVAGLYTLTPPNPQLKGAWFQPFAYQVRNWFQSLPFKFN